MFIKPIQMVRTIRVISRMARRIRISIRRIRIVIRMVIIPRMVTILGWSPFLGQSPS